MTEQHKKSSVAALTLAAVGIVYGDIGTSPLYTLKTIFDPDHGLVLNEFNLQGIISLIFWGLTMIVSLKYVTLVLRADNRGEGGIMALMALALIYVVWLTMNGQNTFVNSDFDSTRWLLAAAGPITAIPLLLFAAGARKIPMAALGLLQYLSPTMQALLGVWVFHEAFPPARLVGFVIIWAALALYVAEGLWVGRRRPHPAT